MGLPVNAEYAARLDEVAQVLEGHGANPFRVSAYRRAAAVLRELPEPVAAIVERGGLGHRRHGAPRRAGRTPPRARARGDCARHHGLHA